MSDVTGRRARGFTTRAVRAATRAPEVALAAAPTRVLYLETISNSTILVADIAALSAIAHRRRDDAALRAAGISPGLLRCSVGLEDAADLEADFAAALDAARLAVGGPSALVDATPAHAAGSNQASDRPRVLAGEATR